MEKNKEISFGHAGRLKIKAGIDKAANAVRPTLGAIGMSAIIEWPGLDPIEADDGVTILKNLKFKDKYEQLGLQKIRKAALRTSAEGGDGTATTTVLTKAFVSEALREIERDSSRIREVRDRLARGLSQTLAGLDSISREVKEEDIEKIALISSLDESVAKVIADVIKEVGVHGVITVEKGAEIGYAKEVVKGARFDSGYVSEYFINDHEANVAVLDKPYIALVDRKVSMGTQMKAIMDAVAKTGNKSILVIADDVAGLALASLIQSSKSVTIINPDTKEAKTGTYDVAAVRNPFTGSAGRDFLLDMAALTGATVISEEAGMRLENAEIGLLGTADKVIITKDQCTVVSGQSSEALEARIKVLTDQVAASVSDYQKDRLKDRLAALTGGIGVIRVGTYTDSDFNSKKYKFDNAVNATQAALQEGILPGGGVALYTISKDAEDPMFREALKAPFLQMAKNAGMENASFDVNGQFGYDFKERKECDMFDAGIIDPFKVVRLALESAVHIASTLVSVETIIVEEEEKK